MDHSEHPMHSGAPEGGHAAHANHASHHQHMAADFQRRFWISLALTVPVLALSPMLQDFARLRETFHFAGDGTIQWLLATIVFVFGGWPFLKGLVDEVRGRTPGMMTLIALAIAVAYGYSSVVVFGLAGRVFFWELATLIDIMLLGHWIEMRSVMGASNALQKLVELMPAEAHRLSSGGEIEDVQVDELAHGDRILIKPGEKMPVDGTIVEGRTTVNEAMITGESTPIEKGESDEVIGGAINGESAITVEVRKTGGETYLAQVIEMVRRAQEARSRTQDLANRAALWLTMIALTSGALTLTVWLLVGRPFDYSLERMVTVMVITCPHALGLAIPLVVAVSTAISARNGLLIRDRSAFERARNLDAIVFDKTGTLTEGRFGVTDIVVADGQPEADVLRIAASVESRSEHPIASGIVEGARERGIEVPTPKDFRAIPGKGALATVGDQIVKVVSPGFLEESGLRADFGEALSAIGEGKTLIYVIVDDAVVGAIALADRIRAESREAIRVLREELGVQVMMLTGDAKPVAAWVADELKLDDYFAEVLPDQKSAQIEAIRNRGLHVAMVGDGVNDAPALTRADVGIAIGAGTDVAIESADIVLVRSDPRDVISLIRLARRTYTKMVQNLWWAAGYNIFTIPLAAGVLYGVGIILSPAAGAVLMSLSTVIVAINARMLHLDPRSNSRGGRLETA